MSLQMMLLGAGAAAEKTYVDDVFSTYVYEGDGATSRNITNNIDLLNQGGLVWYKQRSGGQGHRLVDTERGATKVIESYDSNAEATETTGLKAFLSNGFTIGNEDNINQNNEEFAAWSWKKTPGFFDVVTYTGNGSTRQISHSLGCQPGMMLVKRTDTAADWSVYHDSFYDFQGSDHYYLKLNTNDDQFYSGTMWANTAPTASVFTVGSHSHVNASGGTYVCYLFAGGSDRTTATSKSVQFDTNDFLSFANTSDFVFGTGAYTVEFWIKPYSTPNGNIIFSGADTNGFVINMNSDRVNINKYSVGDVVSSTSAPTVGQWTHYAFVREGTGSDQTKIYVNGKLDKIGTDDNNWTVNANWGLGARNSDGNYGIASNLSNFRIVKGTAVYTSSFRPPTKPLTNITNTKLLCCNGSSTTSSTVTPGTITANGNPAAQIQTPFDDPAGFVFGDTGDQNVIKCGSFTGTGSAYHPVHLGFEPQWLMVKNATSSDGGGESWFLVDSMRGWPVPTSASANVMRKLVPNESAAESSQDWADPMSDGFMCRSGNDSINGSNDTMLYIAIRRPDGYVGKPADAGTDVLSIGTRSGSSSNALACVNTLTDFSLIKNYGAGEYWAANARLMGNLTLKANTNNAHLTGALPTSGGVWDRMLGHLVAGSNGATNSPTGNMVDYGWKRHAGFDVVANLKEFNSHNLGKTPEMVWIKRRDNTADWFVWHKGLNGGTNDGLGRNLRLNTNASENSTPSLCPIGDELPTATHFKTASDSDIRNAGSIAFLFASVDGISKVGSYTGTGSSLTITTGFQPRFVIIKKASGSGANRNWYLLDTTRGWGSGDDKVLLLSDSDSQSDNDMGAPTSTGFTLTGETHTGWNASSREYIYYAHA